MQQLGEARRLTEVDGLDVMFWVHHARPLPIGDSISPAHWILIADGGRGWALMEPLGKGPEPVRTLDEYTDEDLRTMWRRRGL